MFVKKFLERKPVRTAIKKMFGTEQKKDGSTPDNITDFPPTDIAKDLRTMTKILNRFKVDNRYICQIYTEENTATEGIPDKSDIWGLSSQIDDDHNTFSFDWSSYIITNSTQEVVPVEGSGVTFLPYFIRQVTEQPTSSEQMFISNGQILGMPIQSLLYFPGLWIMEVIQEFKKLPSISHFGLQDIRSIFKRVYYFVNLK